MTRVTQCRRSMKRWCEMAEKAECQHRWCRPATVDDPSPYCTECRRIIYRITERRSQ